VWNGGISVKRAYLKFLATFIAVIMLSAVSLGDVPKSVELTSNTGSKDRAILSAEVWSDDFDDGEISDWQVFNVNWSANPCYLLPSSCDNFSLTGGELQAVGPEWNFAGHNSSIAYGTWSFDIDIQMPEEYDHFAVGFICEQFNDDWLTLGSAGDGYALSFYPSNESYSGRISLIRGSHDHGHIGIDQYYPAESLLGWKHIIITRDPSGQFYVYLDNSLILEANNQYYTTSERFYFLTRSNPRLDNITVSDTIDYDSAPPKWDENPANQVIDAGTDFFYNLNATDYSGIDQWWINDTVNFAIDNEGVITNIDALDAGSYVIEVRVNDTLGNMQTGSFRLTVREIPPRVPMELVIAGVGAVVVIIVLVIWRKRS
jgi:hypothetical protein